MSNTYFSDRERGASPRVNEEITARVGRFSYYDSKSHQN
jgi:hypothetical protein